MIKCFELFRGSSSRVEIRDFLRFQVRGFRLEVGGFRFEVSGWRF